jgi:hypothetical protein
MDPVITRGRNNKTMKKDRKTPVVIEAFPYTYPASIWLREWMGSAAGDERKDRHPGALGELEIKTLEDGYDGRAKHVATEGDFIIKGVHGEFYACKPDIFHKTYEPVDE